MKARDAKSFLAAHPNLRRWMRECLRCHRRGYDPARPLEMFPEAMRVDILRFLRPLPTGSDRLCERCDAALHHGDQPDTAEPGGHETDGDTNVAGEANTD